MTQWEGPFLFQYNVLGNTGSQEQLLEASIFDCLSFYFSPCVNLCYPPNTTFVVSTYNYLPGSLSVTPQHYLVILHNYTFLWPIISVATRVTSHHFIRHLTFYHIFSYSITTRVIPHYQYLGSLSFTDLSFSST